MDRKFFSPFRIIAAAAIFVFACGIVAAQQSPPMSHGEQVLQISDDECMRRAPRALRAEGFTSNDRGNNSVFGTKRNNSAYILCVSDGGRNRTRVIVIAASRTGGANAPDAERAGLLRRMDRADGGGGGGGGVGCGLGRRITEYENNFTGIWTRRGRTSVFDAVWTRGSERSEAVLNISLIGNRVTVRRTDAAYLGGNTCTYTGTLDGDRITGTYFCRTGERNIPWEATVECN